MRRHDIAEAAIALIEREGLRGLTHRAVDRELGLPQGSTSYYARTRRDLLTLVVEQLAARTAADIAGQEPARTAAEAAERLAAGLDLVARRAADARARFALTIDLVHDPDLHALLTTASPIRERLLAGATATLEALGVDGADRRAVDLVALTNGLLYDRLAGAGAGGDPADVRAILAAYLEGLPRQVS